MPNPSSDAHLRFILAPTDFGENSRRSVIYATHLAKMYDAELALLHVEAEPAVVGGMTGMVAAPDFGPLHDQAEEKLRTLLDEVRKHHGAASCSLRTGSPSVEIAEEARHLRADLIVLAANGEGWLHRLVHGDATERLTELAPCPVLVVRPKESAPEAWSEWP